LEGREIIADGHCGSMDCCVDNGPAGHAVLATGWRGETPVIGNPCRNHRYATWATIPLMIDHATNLLAEMRVLKSC